MSFTPSTEACDVENLSNPSPEPAFLCSCVLPHVTAPRSGQCNANLTEPEVLTEGDHNGPIWVSRWGELVPPSFGAIRIQAVTQQGPGCPREDRFQQQSHYLALRCRCTVQHVLSQLGSPCLPLLCSADMPSTKRARATQPGLLLPGCDPCLLSCNEVSRWRRPPGPRRVLRLYQAVLIPQAFRVSPLALCVPCRRSQP